MAKKKSSVLYLSKILYERTDENHGLSRKDIVNILLEEYDIEVDRRTFYSDIDLLKDFGMDIESYKEGRDYIYKLISREFETAELKVLVDSIQASRFITKKKSKELIGKIEGLTSVFNAGQLDRQIYYGDRIKAENEMIFINVDTIHTAISSNRKISYKYFDWNSSKEKVFRHENKTYMVSPWALIWDSQNYYLIGYDEDIEEIRHYRVDKMLQLDIVDETRVGQKEFADFNVAEYSDKLFGMFDGDEETVTIEADESKISILFDRFGMNIPIRKLKKSSIPGVEKAVETKVDVVVSDQFITWVLALGNKVKITAPEKVVDKVKTFLEERTELYGS